MYQFFEMSMNQKAKRHEKSPATWESSALAEEQPHRSGALPKYLQLSELLTREVLAGRLADGARLPPEREMAIELNVSVGTLRRALGTLEENRLLSRVHGSGNYICNTAPVRSVYHLFRLELPGGGGLPTARVLELITAPPPPSFRPHVPAGACPWRVRRVRSLDQCPVAVEEIWFYVCPKTTGHEAPPPDISAKQLSESLYLFYRETLGIWIETAQDAVGVASIPLWAEDLTPGATAGFIERFAQGRGGKTVEYSKTWYDPARARYVARLE